MREARLKDEEYMEVARLARKHADCKGRHVGAALVLPNGAVILGANGSPVGRPRCEDGGCYRCAHRDDGTFPPGTAYDICTCVHAEEACLILAAREGIKVEGATIYSTMRPCRECSKQLLQAGVVAAYYEVDLVPQDAAQLAAYVELQNAFPAGVHQLVPETLSEALATTGEIRVEVPIK
jgi:dCMP deaminase